MNLLLILVMVFSMTFLITILVVSVLLRWIALQNDQTRSDHSKLIDNKNYGTIRRTDLSSRVNRAYLGFRGVYLYGSGN
jgi:predicted secreted protein